MKEEYKENAEVLSLTTNIEMLTRHLKEARRQKGELLERTNTLTQKKLENAQFNTTKREEVIF